MEENQAPETEKDLSNKEVINSLKKKNWKSYFKEFFMLFLAVFCGFLAENYRESLTAKKIEKEYILSLIEDLKTDTTNLSAYIEFREEKSILMDSLAEMMLSDNRSVMGNQIYFLARQVFNEKAFFYSDGTIQQLKNAGNLRLLRKRNVVNELLNYEKKVKILNEWDENDNRTKSTFREMGGKVFHSAELNATMDSEMRFVMPTTNPQLITADFGVINEIAFQIHYLSKMTKGNSLRAEFLKSDAGRLLELIHSEYKLN
ncbi:hypothetical protein A33Q_2385 [Indibacter alkaliphilus LW1]|uniref:Uncharacterized protein n=1 Tax=Indibacter alkaliphilus (strain CCUG 57479 / KCTC 22604 / LW1) TaxID=1189612 RepID=S2DHL4_INDAL|nr:hypothetical protein [Indibacter alkaliphilus]EOZ96615.1 hypothetical protein A33Q_2385 [Indibacter alkaliphilus LW1]